MNSQMGLGPKLGLGWTITQSFGKNPGVNKSTRNGATLEVSCSVSVVLLDICIKCCVFLGAG